MTDTANYFLLQNASGYCLGVANGKLRFTALADDSCLWTMNGETMVSSGGGLALELTETAAGKWILDSASHDSASAESAREELVRVSGPTRLVSSHLSELCEQGYTVLDGVMDAADRQALKARAAARIPADAESTDARVGVPDSLGWSPEVASAVTNPVALWLIGQYLGTDAIHYGHPPAVTVLRPAAELLGSHPEMGWHSDYPYHPGVLEEGRWQDESPLGVQFNICVDEFRADNAATQFLPQSHAIRDWPPEAFNSGGTRMGEGVHRDVRQLIAPAGSALIYDSRMWHRACEELNVSGQDRYAVLNAVTLAWVRPMSDKTQSLPVYQNGSVKGAINAREQADILRLCHSATTVPPAGAPQINARDY